MAKGKVLVVDDEEDILKLVSYNLTNNGYTVETAQTGEEALDLRARHPTRHYNP